jgi:hypothetical protein
MPAIAAVKVTPIYFWNEAVARFGNRGQGPLLQTWERPRVGEL